MRAEMVHRGPVLDEFTAKMHREMDARIAGLASMMHVDWAALRPHAMTTLFANQLFQIPQDEPFLDSEVFPCRKLNRTMSQGTRRKP